MSEQDGPDDPEFSKVVQLFTRAAEGAPPDAPEQLDATRLAEYLAAAHGPRAGQEVLLRALVCERQSHRTAARFWLSIYERIASG